MQLALDECVLVILLEDDVVLPPVDLVVVVLLLVLQVLLNLPLGLGCGGRRGHLAPVAQALLL